MRPHDGRTSAVHRVAHGSESSYPRPAIGIFGNISNHRFSPVFRTKQARPASFHWRALLESRWVVKPENGGGGGNRTPVPRSIHVSVYRNSSLFGFSLQRLQRTGFASASLHKSRFVTWRRGSEASPYWWPSVKLPGAGNLARGPHLGSQCKLVIAN